MTHYAEIVDRDHAKVTRQGFAPTLTLGVGTPTQLSFGYFFQHEDNVPDYGYPFFHGRTVRVARDTWYGLTKDDYERTYANIGTVSLSHRFSDALNLRSTTRYSNVRRDLDVSIPQTQCAPATCAGDNAIIEKTNGRTDDPITGADVLEGKQRSRGVELGVAGRILPGWNVFASFTYPDAKITKSNDTQTVEGVTYSLQGKVPQNVPEYTASFWTTYDFLDKWQIGGGPTYVSSRFANNSNSRSVPGYVRWDATVAYNISERIQFRLNAQNFTNKYYIESVHPSHVVPGPGMTFVASTAFRF